jgi:hypothetical protein
MPHPRKEAAAEREREKKHNAKEEKLRKAEDAKWVDNDKNLQAKEARKAEKDAKADDAARKQREKADLLRQEEEMASKIGKNSKLTSNKVKQSDIKISALSGMMFDTKKKKKSEKESSSSDLVHDQPLEPNLNREAMLEQLRTGIKVESGTGTAEALSAITAALGDIKLDPHPEKRMKQLHATFEERRLKELMIEKPNLKRSQYKEMIWKEWQKSPENPMRTLPA